VRFVDADEARRLNRDYRHRDYATNVLSFPYAREPVVCGDLVLCAPVVAREAADARQATGSALCTPDRARHAAPAGLRPRNGEAMHCRMEKRERRVLAALGYPDPYREENLEDRHGQPSPQPQARLFRTPLARS
jgi:probable rRNA maturation factor